MKYAVIASGNKQFRVAEGDIIEIDRLAVKPQDKYTFPQVLLYVDDSQKKIGRPILTDVTVVGEVIENLRGKKIRVAKFKAKSRYRRVRGFRPEITKIKIATIGHKENK